LSSSSSSSNNHPQFSAYTTLNNFKKQYGIEENAKFINFGKVKEKDISDRGKLQKSFTELFIKKTVDPSMDFMDQRKKISLQKLYNKNPVAMPNKEVKLLRFSKIDKFATKVENEADLIGNATIAAAACFEANQGAKAMFHLNNIIDIARDLRSNANTERLDLKDKRSASAIRRHISVPEIL
jgi:hypothetical protein